MRAYVVWSVKLCVTTEGRRPRSDGTYPRSSLTTEVNSIRNTPSTSTSTQYHATGYVFNDTNRDKAQNGAEVGHSPSGPMPTRATPARSGASTAPIKNAVN